jgi:hypothetical protein
MGMVELLRFTILDCNILLWIRDIDLSIAISPR